MKTTDAATPPVDASKKKMMTLANKITILRIITIPVIVIGMIESQKEWVYVLLGFSMMTDLLDGLAARYRGERTRLGAFLDPLADKLLLTSVYMTLTLLGIVQTWVFVVVFSRDLLIVLGWVMIFILTGSTKIQPQILGKITTAVQMITALTYIIPLSLEVQRICLWTSIALTVASAIDYILVGQKRLASWD